MNKSLRESLGVALLCAIVCILIVIGDCYLINTPQIHPIWQSLAGIATLAVLLPALVIGIWMTAYSIAIVQAQREASRSNELLLRAGLDPTDF